MAEKYSTIQQHQPLRVPQGWSGQERRLIVQLDEIFDDIYKRFGRLKISDFGTELKKVLSDTEGDIASIELSIQGLTTEVSNKIAKTTTLQSATDIVNTAESYTDGKLTSYSTTSQTADAIALAVGDCYGKVSNITINTTGIKLETNKILDLQSGCELRIRSGADVVVYSGGSMAFQSGGEFKIVSGATVDIVTDNFKITPSNSVTFKGGGEILGDRTLKVNDDAQVNILSGGALNIQSGGNMTIQSGGELVMNSGGAMTINSGGALTLKSGADLELKSGSDLLFTSSGNTRMSMNSNGIDMVSGAHINLDVDTNNYVHISPTGIDMKGTRVSINGNYMWARDDIIVMNPNSSESWRRTVANIESHMTGLTDWVLIRPYYDASIAYTGATGNGGTDSVIISSYTKSGSAAFGDSADWYNYAISITANNTSGTAYTSRTVKVYLSDRPFSFVTQQREQEAQTQAKMVLSWTGTISGNGTTSISMDSGHVAENLCKESSTIYYYVYGLGLNNNININAHTLTATTAATSRKVPCTVYYYH